MEAFYERLMVRAATIDELLSDAFETLPGQRNDADLAARRLAAWCRSCAGGDWSLFERRLERDGLSIGRVLARFATARRRVPASIPAWTVDAIWVEAALQSLPERTGRASASGDPCAFEHLFAAVVEHADAALWSAAPASSNLSESARTCLRLSLMDELSRLTAPAIYERFAKARQSGGSSTGAEASQQDGIAAQYDQFVADMRAGGFRRLFEDKPVLLRLIASATRQWIDTSREFIKRLDADLATIRRDLLHSSTRCRITRIECGLSDPHNLGHSVQTVHFEDGSRIVYKPKDLRVDAAWHAMIERLNLDGAPIELRAARVVPRNNYGWAEFVAHRGCSDAKGCKQFFRRAGAWLALFHCFAATDMHHENMIAAGDHPVPIDLEMVLQATPEEGKTEDEAQAFEAAMDAVAKSVLVVGLLPGYGKSPGNGIFVFGGVVSDWTTESKLAWDAINSDSMRPSKAIAVGKVISNLPHVDGRYAKFGDHLDDFVSGFDDYARFLLHRTRDAKPGDLFDDFAGVPIRKIIRPTRFYAMLLQRLKDHRSMDDGIVWSAQADFMARLTDWDRPDPVWPLQSAERTALVALNVPHFVIPSDGNKISDAAGASLQTEVVPGLDRARARMQDLGEEEIAYQIDIIRQNTGQLSTSSEPAATPAESKKLLLSPATITPTKEYFIAQADAVAEHLSRHAIRRGAGAAWIGLDWLGDSEVSQIVALGPELYNGACGIALFLAAHAAVAERGSSEDLARAALVHVRKTLRSQNAARMARTLGIGGGTGLGSIVYALTVLSSLLEDDELLADAHVTAELLTDELITADKQLDAVSGSAGAILALLRLYRQSQSADVLGRATVCGRHLLAQRRLGQEGQRSWSAQGSARRPLNGMSHGAAGFAYALASLAAATGREDFAKAAWECIAFENASYDAERCNWPDLRDPTNPHWPCQWCYGASGIGLARIATMKYGEQRFQRLVADVRNALAGAERGWPSRLDTLCCGSLGNIEFFCEAGNALDRNDLRELAAQRLISVLETARSAGDFRWNSGRSRFNLGLFRGIAGVGYTVLRNVDSSLPNVLVWE